MSARERILERLRASLAEREAVEHPGRFEGWRPEPPPDPLEAFNAAFRGAGGRCLRTGTSEEASEAMAGLCRGHGSVAIGEGVPPELRPALASFGAQAGLAEGAPEDADLAISMARGAVGETGTLLLDARDGRRTQLLAPTHVVLVRAHTIHASLAEALAAMRSDLPSAVGLHSGPSKSADIGQVMVRGVHGPGEVVALVIGEG